MLPSLNDYFHAKLLRYRLIPSRDIDDQRILQSDWTGDTTENTQPKVVVSSATFPLITNSMQYN